MSKLGKKIIRTLEAFRDKLRAGKPIEATRVERRPDGKITQRKVILPLACLAFLPGCWIGSERQAKTSNSDAKVDVLFTDEDGYTVKRFHDMGQVHYYVTPGPAEIEQTISDGDVVMHRRIATSAK